VSPRPTRGIAAAICTGWTSRAILIGSLLIAVYPEDGDHPVFDSVVVVTDRRELDKQLRSTIRQFSEVKNIIAPAMSSQDLKHAIEEGGVFSMF
jgi:type I site-specific restriction-modification system R (restriction) subunit